MTIQCRVGQPRYGLNLKPSVYHVLPPSELRNESVDEYRQETLSSIPESRRCDVF